MTSPIPAALLTTPLTALHHELGARMVPFAGYTMPVQYPAGLMAEHAHTRQFASLFDVSHMGQLRLVGDHAASALERLLPVDVVGLGLNKQRYGVLLNDEGGIIDDLMLVRREDDIFVIVNGACKTLDIQYITQHIGQDCQVIPLPDQALLALQGPQSCTALTQLVPDVAKLVFMTGCAATTSIGQHSIPLYVTRSGYTGEDGFEISLANEHAEIFARALLALADVRPAGLGARNSLRLEAGLCLYGNDIDTTTTPSEAGLNWAIQKVRRTAGARAGGFMGATKVLAQLDEPGQLTKVRVGLVALERIPVREHTPLHSVDGQNIGEVTSGLLGPTCNQPIAMGYVAPDYATHGTTIHAIVRGKPVAMQVCPTPFVPHHYHRG